jgi:T5SS/PEP-CTERM-associated repeat protein/autotransporter-associated beta strand protein
MAPAAILWSGDVSPNDPTIWNSSTECYIGQTATGIIAVDGGSGLQSGRAYLGDNSGSIGTTTVTGTDSTWTITGDIDVGYCGSGTLKVESGGEVTDATAYVGSRGSTATGTVTVSGIGSKWINKEGLYIGASANDHSTLNVEMGGEVSSSYAYISSSAKSSTASAVVTGTGSKWTSGNLYVGDLFGNGTLTVSDGGIVTTTTLCAPLSNLLGNGTIAAQGAVLDADLVFDGTHGLQQTLTFGTDGTLNLNLNGNGVLGAGYKGAGTLRIADGVVVASTGGYLGYQPGSIGTVTVTGTGSKWNSTGSLIVGANGSGFLNIEAGGQVIDDNGYVGLYNSRIDPHCSGTVTVTGIGSSWTNSINLIVGGASSGTLNIGTGIGSGGLVMAKTFGLANQNDGICNLNGGTLQVGSINSGSADFNWYDGTIRNYNGSNLIISNPHNNSFVLKLAATGTHSFYIDGGCTGSVYAVLSDATSGGTLVKNGKGLLKLLAANTYTGSTTITEGTLALSNTGSLASTTIDLSCVATFDVTAKSGGFVVQAGQKLTGAGTIVGDLTIYGIHAPGDLSNTIYPQLSKNMVMLNGNYSMLGQLQMELNGTTLDKHNDQVLLRSNRPINATLGGTLMLDWTGVVADWIKDFCILRNDTAGTLSGTFSNYANGANLGYHGGKEWFIWYGAILGTGSLSGGNDVLITTVPEPCTLVLLGFSALGFVAWFGWRQKVA